MKFINPKCYNMKTIKISLVLPVLLLVTLTISGQTTGKSVSEVILSAFSVKDYTTVPVTDQQLTTILSCGIKAPSAVNAQPWKFTVVKDETTMQEIIEEAVAGNVLIVVSGKEPEQGGSTPDFDCGLAAESMYIAAHGLGLGARIYGSPARVVNRNREAYQIPEGYRAIVVLRVGNVAPGVDAVSSASPRKDFNEVVNYMK